MQALMASIVQQLKTMNDKMSGIEDRIATGIATAIDPIAKKIDASNKRIDNLEKKRSNEIEEIKKSLLDHMDKILEECVPNYANVPKNRKDNQTRAESYASTYASALATLPKLPSISALA